MIGAIQQRARSAASRIAALAVVLWPSRRARWIAAACLVVGFVVGGAHGWWRYSSLASRPAVCVSCHHDQPDPSHLLASETNHSFDFRAPCHICHVLPTDAYISFVAEGVLGAQAPAWMADLGRPVIADQTCQECHLGRGRGHIECERCHQGNETQVHITRNCELCHQSRRPCGSHSSMDCRHCHVATHLDQDDRRDFAMRAKYSGAAMQDDEDDEDDEVGEGDEVQPEGTTDAG